MPNSIIKRIKSLQIQGAKEIAVASLKYLKIFCRKNGFGKEFTAMAEKLERSRPTAVVLHNCLGIIKKEKRIEAIDSLLDILESSTDRIASNGSRIIKNNSTIMTHCHSSEALAVIKYAKKRGKNISVIATETEPRHQGIRTARELANSKIKVELIADSAAGYYMPLCSMVLVGADAIRKEGIVNKIGTNMMATEAEEQGKPLYVAASKLKFDKRKRIKIEMRPPSEIHRKMKGVEILNPAFDITPWSQVTAVITEGGVMKPKEILRELNEMHFAFQFKTKKS